MRWKTSKSVLFMITALATFLFLTSTILWSFEAQKPGEVQIPDAPEIHGFSATWTNAGEGVVDSNGNSSLLTLDLKNNSTLSLTIHLRVLAVFGSISNIIQEGDYSLAAKSEDRIPISVSGAMNLHEKQAKYATTVRCQFSVKTDFGAEFGYRLASRYLAANPSGYLEVLDREALEGKYEYGITDPAELTRVKSIVQNDNSGNVLIGVGPGVPMADVSGLF